MKQIFFQSIFGDPKNTDILENFLQSILNLPKNKIRSLAVVDPQADTKYGNTATLNAEIHMDSGEAIAIAIQFLSAPKSREEIALNSLYTKQSYETIQRNISIIITDYVLISEDENYHHEYCFRNDKNDSKLNAFQINTLELPKLPEQSDGSDLWYWMQFVKADSEEDFAKLSKENVFIEKAIEILTELNQHEAVRLRKEAQQEIAMRMLADKMPVDMVAKYTEFSLTDIEKMANELT